MKEHLLIIDMHQKLNLKRHGFSLVEVVVAVGIFSLAIVGVIGLLGPTSKSIAEVSDSDAATRVVTAIQTELQRIAQSAHYPITTSTTSGFQYIANTFLQPASNTDISGGGVTPNTYTFYASRDGSRIGLYSDTNNPDLWEGPNASGTTVANFDGLKYFEIVLIRNGDYPNAGDGLSPTANDSTAGFLAFTVRLRWPAYLPDGTHVLTASAKSSMIVPMAVTR